MDAVPQWPDVLLLFASGFLLGRGVFSSKLRAHERPLAILLPIAMALQQVASLLHIRFRGAILIASAGLLVLGFVLNWANERSADRG